MVDGQIVEIGPTKAVLFAPRHPYTQGLFRSIPLPGADKNARPLIAIPGQLPLPHERPKGCNFGPRCHHFVEGVCNAAETLLVHEAIAPSFLPQVAAALTERGVDLRGCTRTREILPSAKPASDVDWDTEYLDLILSIRVVPSIDAALAHIHAHSTGGLVTATAD